MPTSWHETIPNILKKVEHFKPKTILDIGVGFGKYGVLLREKFELPFERFDKSTWTMQIDGVEAFSGYRNPLHDYVYNQIFYENITGLVDKLPRYDVVLMIDVLEHFDKDTGIKILKSLAKIAEKAIIISTPLYPDPQHDYIGNKFEEHKSRWTNVDFCEFDYTAELVRIENNAGQIFIIYPEQTSDTVHLDEVTLQVLPQPKRPLTVGYFLPHKNLTGGLKMLLLQMEHLRGNGHRIIALYRGNPGEKVLPDWSDLQVDKEVLVPMGESILPYLDECDVGVAGWLEQLPELAKAKIPIVYWEQGNEWLFGENFPSEYRAYLQHCYKQPAAIASVSPVISKSIQARFNRKTRVIPNGIDVDFYYPAQPPNQNVILLVGNPHLLFKGFDIAIRTLIRTWKAGKSFKVKWVCQVPPNLEGIPFPFPIEYVVNPPQTELAACYRQSDIFLFTSWYEGFGMPPLEAMASGVPVVCTRCGGIDVFAEDGTNAILAEPGDVNALSEGVIYLLDNPQERHRYSLNGRETALKFKFSNIIQELEQYLIHLVSNHKQ